MRRRDFLTSIGSALLGSVHALSGHASPGERGRAAGAADAYSSGHGGSPARSLFPSALASGKETSAQVHTVTGPVAAGKLGLTLMHEHVLVDFIGADLIVPGRYSPEQVIAVVLPHLERIVKLGCGTLVDCTPAYLGRDPRLLARLARRAALNIVTTTGYYGAGSPPGRFVPAAAQAQTPERLARIWTEEYRQGIDSTKNPAWHYQDGCGQFAPL